MKYIIGNWKMHGLQADGIGLTDHIANYYNTTLPKARCVLCPPATLAFQVSERLRRIKGLQHDHGCFVGAQDCHPEESGSYTGDISAAMLKDAGCEYVILGHSERRLRYGETDALVRRKANAAIKAGLTPIICVGESLSDQKANRTIEVVQRQIQEAVPDGIGGGIIIAYEPIWAIGSGKMPTLDDIEMVHGAIFAFLAEKKGITNDNAIVVYGGSVKPGNAEGIFKIPDVSGVLVGGASLDADQFCAILAATGAQKKG